MGDRPRPACGTGIRQTLSAAGRTLARVSGTPQLDAELLMAHALGVTREALLLRHLDDADPPGYRDLVARRLAREPVAYITGRRAFWTIDLEVGPGVLIPRPDSETLIEAAVAHFAGRAPARILDLGTGPGTLLLAALDQWPAARGLGVDISEEALAYARRNAARLGLAERAQLRRGDWAEGIAERFDLVLANPPYIGTGEAIPEQVRGHEPGIALFAGADGLDAYRAIVPGLPRLLGPGGIALLEIGSAQAGAVSALVRTTGLESRVHADLRGLSRVVAGLES